MPTPKLREVLAYLLDCPPIDQDEIYLQRLNQNNLLCKELTALLERIIENRAVVILANALRNYGRAQHPPGLEALDGDACRRRTLPPLRGTDLAYGRERGVSAG